MVSDGFYTEEELRPLGFREVGANVLVSRKACFYGLNATIGDSSRIDDFSILKGNVTIGNFVHISAFCMIGGAHGRVIFEDCSGLACRVTVYTASDDYRASALNNPTVPSEFSKTIMGDVSFGLGSIVGAHSVVLPNSSIGEGASIGAFSLVRGAVPAGAIIVSVGAARTRIVGSREIATIRSLRDQLVTGSSPRR